MIRQAARKFLSEVRSPTDGVTFLTRLAVPVDPRARQLHSWVWGKLPRVELDKVFPGIRDVDITILRAVDRAIGTSLNLEERASLLAVAKATQARRILEVGTYDGNTALNLAANAPEDATVTTIDLPPSGDVEMKLTVPDRFMNVTNRAVVGTQYRGTTHETKIRQVFGDSAALDWSEFASGGLDLVFIDGCHYREYVQSDTENALRYLTSGGIVVWHDYGYFKDVSDYVDEMAQRMKVSVIGGTRLAIGFTNSTSRDPVDHA
jgi:predicted O-methyltransferase YrrM